MNEAFFRINKNKVLQNFKEVKQVSDLVSYSVKTNPSIVRILEKETDSFFTVVYSVNLLKEVKNKNKVWFFPQGWTENELKELVNIGLNNFVLDNEKDYIVFKNFLKTSKNFFNILLRIRLKERTIKTGKHYVYGMYSKNVKELINELKGFKNVKKLGIHFHRKTQNINEWRLKEELLDLFDEDFFKKIDYVNIGGGLPSFYKNSKTLIKPIFEKIMELKIFLNNLNVKLIIEPGRFISASCCELVTNVRQIVDKTVIINCSIYNSYFDSLVSDIKLLVKDEVENEGFTYLIKGCTPDSMDIFRYRVSFKKKLRIRDEIVFLNAGAYNFSTNFFSLKNLKTIFV